MAHCLVTFTICLLALTFVDCQKKKKIPEDHIISEDVLGSLGPANEEEMEEDVLYLNGAPVPSDLCLDCMCGVQSGDSSPGCGTRGWWEGDGLCPEGRPQSGCVMSRGQCRCGPYLINERIFQDCAATVPLPLDDWELCSSNNDCARMCLKEFMAKHALTCTGKSNPKKVTCSDFARMLYGGKDKCKSNKTKLFGRAVNRCMVRNRP